MTFAIAPGGGRIRGTPPPSGPPVVLSRNGKEFTSNGETNVVAGSEYRLHNCQAGSFVYGQPLALSTATLSDVVAGDVLLGTAGASEEVTLQFDASSGVMNTERRKLLVMTELTCVPPSPWKVVTAIGTGLKFEPPRMSR